MFLFLFFLVAVLPVNTEGGEILWGTESKPHSRPYMAFINFYDSNSDLNRCGGFLVAKDIVMTAAHCNGRNIKVILGAHNIKKRENTQVISVLKAKPHENFNSDSLVNDIMLLKLERKAQLNGVVKTIALPRSQDWVKPGQGDSGGPFVCNGVAQGIVSYRLCTWTPPRVFTRISSFIPWIQKTMKLLQQP
ncbi:mast cell protease 9 isoform X1 [Rattus norvegicus]|uniref:mast cell protease 9 isoform X1 n=1 Tax=Rattus norvegicus TaxID=10116 RepID=UPI002FD7BE44